MPDTETGTETDTAGPAGREPEETRDLGAGLARRLMDMGMSRETAEAFLARG